MKNKLFLTFISASLLTLVGCGGNTSSTPSVTPTSSPEQISKTPDSAEGTSSTDAGTTYNIADGVYFIAVADYSGDKVEYKKAVPLNGENYPDITNMETFESYAKKSSRGVEVADSIKIKGSVVYQNGNYKSSSTIFSSHVKSSFSYDSATGKFVYTGEDDADFWNKLVDVEGLNYVIASDGSFSQVSSLADKTNVTFAVPVAWILDYNKSITDTYDAKFIGIYAD